MTKRAFLTGASGQDGSYLAEFLLAKGYDVHAIVRRSSVFTSQRIDHILNHPNFHTYLGDLTDSSNLHRLLGRIEPEEIYNLAAQSHVAVSFEVPEYTAEVDAIGCLRLLDAIKDLGIKPRRPSCSVARSAPSPRASRPSSTPALPMPRPSSTPTG